MTKGRRSRFSAALINLGIAVASILVSLGLVEIVLRVALLKDPWTTRNFTVEAINQSVTNLATAYDPLLGYIPKPNLIRGKAPYFYSHGDFGIRLNETPETENSPADRIREGGILAVGDSFVYGSEVTDTDTWPAQLEQLVRVPVVNGGSGGYGWDQAYLRAEQLAAKVKPQIIIMGCIPNCAQRNELILNAGLVKPYFRVDNGELVLENVPVQPYRPARKHLHWYQYYFGPSYTLYWLADRLGLRSKWLTFEYEYQYAKNDGVMVTCKLMDKLSTLAKKYDSIPVLLFEYSGYQVTGFDQSRLSTKVDATSECARNAGVMVVDSYEPLLAQYKDDERTFWNNWVDHPAGSIRHNGHMTKQGNHFIAKLIADRIRGHIRQ